MKKPKRRNVWFNAGVGTGAMLGVLLLVQSVTTYFQVSKDLVAAALVRDARAHVTELEREIRQLRIDTPAEVGEEIEEMRQEEATKIAWIKVLDLSGQTIAQSGAPVGPAFDAEQVRLAVGREAEVFTMRDTSAGPVVVNLIAIRRLARTSRGPRRTPEESGSLAGGPGLVEMALYWNSASGDFSRLRRREIVSSLAALGLVGAMTLLWLRFPHYVQGMQVKQQAELARSVQADLLLAPDSVFPDLSFAAECIPAWQVGGDFYDVFSNYQGHVAIAIGDVSGNGLPASVVAGVLVGAVRAGSWQDGKAEHEASSRRLNELLCARTSLERYATLFWSYYDPGGRVLHFINAGHPYPILLRRKVAGGDTIERLEGGGPVMGLLPSVEYRQGSTSICPGDVLVLYSDGLTEAPNISEEEFGEERLIAGVRECARKSPVEIRDEILARVRAFIGEEEIQDDLTFVVVRFEPGKEARI